MKQEQLIELAKNCGYWSGQTIEMNDIGLKMFADMVALEITKELMQIFTDPENQPSQYGTVTIEYMEEQIKAEREACAKVCEEIAEEFPFEPHEPDPVLPAYCAEAIRARGDK
jgi:phosphoglucomutase